MSKNAQRNTNLLFIFLCVLVLLFSCNNSKAKNQNTAPFSQTEWDFDIDFPKLGLELKTSSRKNPKFPGSKVEDWTMEGTDAYGYCMYFVTKDLITSKMGKEIHYFEDGYYDFLKSVLGGGMKNFDGINIHYQKFKCDTLYVVQATARRINDDGVGAITYRAYTNGHQLLVIGAVSHNPNDSIKNSFFNSFKINKN